MTTSIEKKDSTATLLGGGRAANVIHQDSTPTLLGGGQSARVRKLGKDDGVNLSSRGGQLAIPTILSWGYSATATIFGCEVTTHAVTDLACVVSWRCTNGTKVFTVRGMYGDQIAPHSATNDELGAEYAGTTYQVEYRLKVNDEIVVDWTAKDSETLTIPVDGNLQEEY